MPSMAGMNSGGGRLPPPFSFHRPEHMPISEDEQSGSSGPAGVRKRGMPLEGMAQGGGEGEVVKKPRGRPPGSKNKPKPPIIITRDAGTGMRPHVFEVASGCDVVESIATFARRQQRGLCVLGGSGTVSNVTLRQPAAPGATITLHGRFEILSLSGAYLLPPAPFTSAGFTISLAGAQGQVLGGSVVGALMAASPVLIIAASFIGQSYDRLPLNDEDQMQLSVSGSHMTGLQNDPCNMSLYNISQNALANYPVPPDHVLAWAAAGVRPPF
ncbi:hypothetical protein O6H91_05G118500 [Diphasiastrum complanatum]|uniref:Uncharacterized protein n=1 Tax=Diphasiastrum complanatum TaxID=34168 RepID=A0ACC2DT08_DIPCM|nr:hypothetical protein O6H91_05G118500 [Diphasiastrum complanatum]